MPHARETQDRLGLSRLHQATGGRRRWVIFAILMVLAGVVIVAWLCQQREPATPLAREPSEIAPSESDQDPAQSDTNLPDNSISRTDAPESKPPTTIEVDRSPEPGNSNSTVDDVRYRKLLLGRWKRSFMGERVLAVRENGKATLVIKPSRMWAELFGKQVTINIEWKVQDGRIIYGVTGGSPASKLQMAKSMWGDHWNEQILELNDQRLLLLGEDGETTYEYERLGVDGI